MAIKALLIGCGNIGAGYDLNDPTRVWSHAKAYSMLQDVELSIFDQDREKARHIARHYHATSLEVLEDCNWRSFDIISITTPTPTHYLYLEKILPQNTAVVICEKPVVNSIKEVEQLANLYKNTKTKILVNYIRRFQPAYQIAKERLRGRRNQDGFKGIIVKYKRGFLNNASHALDLLEFLFEKPFEFESFYCAAAAYDAFENDPTITGTCRYLSQPVSFVGITNTDYPIFEIELFFSNSKVVICHSGNEIRYYYNKAGMGLKENKDERQTAILDSYMLPVMEAALGLLYNKDQTDNFASSLRINKQILQIIEPLKTQSACPI